MKRTASTLRAGAVSLGIALATALMAVAAFAPTAYAHAKPTTSSPSPNQNLSTAPTTVSITFVQHVKPEGSDIIVYDKDGKKVSTAAAAADPANLYKMSVPMQGDDSEAYLVVWHTVSADDGESAIGAFSFGVNAKADDLPTPPSASSQGVSPLIAGLIGLAGLLVGAGGGFAFFRRQRPSA